MMDSRSNGLLIPEIAFALDLSPLQSHEQFGTEHSVVLDVGFVHAPDLPSPSRVDLRLPLSDQPLFAGATSKPFLGSCTVDAGKEVMENDMASTQT